VSSCVESRFSEAGFRDWHLPPLDWPGVAPRNFSSQNPTPACGLYPQHNIQEIRVTTTVKNEEKNEYPYHDRSHHFPLALHVLALCETFR
jgi:hypothetical protein